ncbi:MAG TPA: DUF1648 domain-containing protein [Candidatus Marinimicrobia bacterium]|nr:DUF1648 domain-containing protein [Candidatus Neomarinimicrobiota bacterium]
METSKSHGQLKEARPKISLQISAIDKILEIAGWLTLCVFWVLVILSYFKLPAIIPTHYNAGGEADAFGNKAFLFVLPGISTMLFGVLTILNRFPHLFNYPSPISFQNARQQYSNATRLIRYQKFIIVAAFAYISFVSIQTAKGPNNGLSLFFLPLFLALVFIPLTIAIVKSLRMK